MVYSSGPAALRSPRLRDPNWERLGIDGRLQQGWVEVHVGVAGFESKEGSRKPRRYGYSPGGFLVGSGPGRTLCRGSSFVGRSCPACS